MNEVQKIKDEIDGVRALVNAHGQLGEIATSNEVATKTLLLATASYFEERICRGIVSIYTSLKIPYTAVSLIESKAIKRQYHTFFSWKANNANVFLKLFGSEFESHINGNIADDAFREGISAFIKLGSERNNLVHNNYAARTVDLSYDEIWSLFLKANDFVEKTLGELESHSTP